jgi:hypothetical protein
MFINDYIKKSKGDHIIQTRSVSVWRRVSLYIIGNSTGCLSVQYSTCSNSDGLTDGMFSNIFIELEEILDSYLKISLIEAYIGKTVYFSNRVRIKQIVSLNLRVIFS